MEECVSERLQFEMGIKANVDFYFSFHYKTPFDNGLIENEIDHVYLGKWDGEADFNPSEVAAVKWVDLANVKKDMDINPDSYTYWFKHIVKYYSDKLHVD